mmetsp:Transcript_71367/g.126088  ORF Transcript_71367/g.126088 Transcript_71367/m.126088 type:complete len:94 (-) Transcript_71367:156-437(-)|eukprot:CAMPEP_0197657562 /NCGR_PEP_ID=MMETSP1338-20131121/44705_1 /TAXON_ID=43686 ORGANISM="Pelagodinium beii, Strain RCC1491" /NCGR_SAMPLE_ID=MMETSP1338 /ASSEMBLY_ACC=CAM_ASM_000754 /LENGTH=93 /DNA_ID=CAMNT_0043233957 /DNA_START=62 /DNA_END=343 /DNA_ORIENTATION=-
MDVNVAVGVCVAAGGVMGYVKKKSIPSLLAGGLSGAGLVACGVMSYFKSAASLSALLLMMMGPNFVKSGKVMPAGMVTVLSTGSLLYNVWKLA